MKKVILVIPCYNEEESILNTYSEIIKYNEKTNNKLDMIVINDGSVDNTKKILEKNNIPYIDLINNLGIGGAVQTGFKYAYENNYDIAIQFDGDGQHDVNYVSDLVNALEKTNADMVIGSRFIEKDKDGFKSTKARRIGINVISFFIKLKTNVKIYDVTSGFRAINQKLMKTFIYDYPVEYPEPISTVNALHKKCKIVEVPVVMKKREKGKSSISSWKNIYYMINVILSIMLMKGNKYYE